jgi:hypothetical protein
MRDTLSKLGYLLLARTRKALAGGLTAAVAVLSTDLLAGRPINWGFVVAAFITGWGGVAIAPANKPKAP